MKPIAVYPGTFDPITNGHSDLIQRAANMFDKVFVAVAESRSKEPAFTLAERIILAENVLLPFKNVEVCGFNQLLVNFAREINAKVILRGLRAVSDFEFEFQLAGMNRHLAPEIETIFMTPAEQYAYLSSSVVREVSALGGDVSHLVHADVLKALNKRLNKLAK